jgi:hypothetical protein
MNKTINIKHILRQIIKTQDTAGSATLGKDFFKPPTLPRELTISNYIDI